MSFSLTDLPVRPFIGAIAGLIAGAAGCGVAVALGFQLGALGPAFLALGLLLGLIGGSLWRIFALEKKA